jgi:hypothetical protein
VRRASILALFVAVFVSGIMLAVALPGPSRGGDGEGGAVGTAPCGFEDPLDDGGAEDSDTNAAAPADGDEPAGDGAEGRVGDEAAPGEDGSADDAWPVPLLEEGCAVSYRCEASEEWVEDDDSSDGDRGIWVEEGLTCFSFGGYVMGSDDNP